MSKKTITAVNVSALEKQIAALNAQLEAAKKVEEDKKQILADVEAILETYSITFDQLSAMMGDKPKGERKARAQRAWQIASRFESQLPPYSGSGRMPKWLVELKGSGELDAIGDQLKLVHSQTGEEVDFDAKKLTELL